jgi:hypothetical protein
MFVAAEKVCGNNPDHADIVLMEVINEPAEIVR